MVVKRIVANIATDRVEEAKAFYGDVVRRFYVHDPFGRLINILAHD